MFYTNCNKAFCSAECGATLSLQMIKNKQKKEDSEFKAETRRRKAAINKESKSHWVDLIRVRLHKWIKIRDKDDPCISCGRFDHEIPDTHKGKWDAGHFRSQGAAKQLRFEPLNIHKQCFQCNRGGEMWSKKRDTVTMNYEKNLITKIGQDKVNELKFNNTVKRYTLTELTELFAYWDSKLKEAQNDTCN